MLIFVGWCVGSKIYYLYVKNVPVKSKLDSIQSLIFLFTLIEYRLQTQNTISQQLLNEVKRKISGIGSGTEFDEKCRQSRSKAAYNAHEYGYT